MTIADSRYVSFTTFRRTGEAVATPVWMAPMPDGRLTFTTTGDAGKVKRLAHTARVLLRPHLWRVLLPPLRSGRAGVGVVRRHKVARTGRRSDQKIAATATQASAAIANDDCSKPC